MRTTPSSLPLSLTTYATPLSSPMGRRHLLVRGAALCMGGFALKEAVARDPGSKQPSESATSFYSNLHGMRLQDQDGKRLSTERFLGNWVLVNFVYTGCSSVCPVQTQALNAFRQALAPALRQQLRLLSLSIDPLNDTPAALRAFAQRMNVDPTGWRFATGRPEDISRLSEALRLFRPGPESRKPDDHSTAVWLLDRSGQVRMRYAGNPLDTQRLASELATLQKLDA